MITDETDPAEELRRLRDDLVRAQTTARLARRRVDELEAMVASSADAVAERDLIREQLTDIAAVTARAERAERTVTEIHASRLWRVAQAYDRATRRLRRP